MVVGVARHMVHEAVVGVEALVERMRDERLAGLSAAAHAPLADRHRAVAAPLHHRAERLGFGDWMVEHVVVDGAAVLLDARQDRGARRRADRCRAVVVGEDHAFGGEARRLDARHVGGTAELPGPADVAVAEVVGEDEDDVGLLRRMDGGREAGGEDRQAERSGDGLLHVHIVAHAAG